MSDQNHSKSFSENNFWDKVKGAARTAGESVLEPALKMYYSAIDSDTPVWAKTTIIAALGYFISPIDAVPDVIPVVGYTDDLGILVAALSATAAHIKNEHVKKAKETLKEWFY
ncbi:MAG: YkvA family protein [Proteobacteria bacterium]|nr:YkvA family protein [Pseudomonadota bacterium]